MLFFALPIVAACALLLYCYKRESIKTTVARTYWNILRKKVEFDTYMQSNSPMAICIKPDYYIVHTLSTNETARTPDDDPDVAPGDLLNTVKSNLNEDTIIFRCTHINGVLYYMRVQENTTIEDVLTINIIEPPFIELELEQNETKTGIREHLYHFYIKKNVILDNKFLKWYLRSFYQIELADVYILHIVDSSINMLSVSSTDDFYEKFVL